MSASEVIDASRALCCIDLLDRALVRETLRVTMVKQHDPLGQFDAAFERWFRPTTATPARSSATTMPTRVGNPGAGSSMPPSGNLDPAVLKALLDGDSGTLQALAAHAVDAFAGIDDTRGTERYHLHRVLRGIDLSRMLSAAMQQLRRDGGLDDLELMLRRNELAAALDEFRRRLASEIADRLRDRTDDDGPGIPERVNPAELDLLRLSRADHDAVRLALQPLLRRLAAAIGQKRRRAAQGRLDLRRTVRRSLQYGGVPIEVVHRRRHPHKPQIVVLCDVSGSVAEFAQFTFTIINALHDEVRDVRSFAFVDGVAEVSDIFQQAEHDIAVNRLVERRGVVGLDGHSDYGAVFTTFLDRHLEDAVGSGTTVIVTGDARGNYRDDGAEQFERIAARARRVFWLNPEPRERWGQEDSLIEHYRRSCTAVHEVRTLNQLADVIAELV